MEAHPVIARVWAGIHDWLDVNAPGLRDQLGPPASRQTIAAAERDLGLSFPESYRESLLLHDGEADEIWLFGQQSLLPLDYVVKMWRDTADLPPIDLRYIEGSFPPELRPDAWPRWWIPVAYDGSGGYLHIDTHPSPRGIWGQIVQSTSDAAYWRVAADFGGFLVMFLDHLKAGRFRVADRRLEAVAGRNDWWSQH